MMNVENCKKYKIALCCTILTMLIGSRVSAQEVRKDTSKNVTARYGDNGFEFNTRDNKFLLQTESRFQFRLATPEDADPVTYDDFTGEKKTTLKINRARLKIGGHAFQPWLKYYSGY